MPGPPRKPGRVLEGSDSWRAKQRIAEEAAVGIRVKYPSCPKHLTDKEARKEWNRIRRLYKELRVFTEADQATLGIYCQAVADVKRYTQRLTETGEIVVTPNGALQRHPYTIMIREARDRVAKTSSVLGLNASDRSRVVPLPKDKKANEFSKLKGDEGGEASG